MKEIIINDVKIPIIYKEDKLPLTNLYLIFQVAGSIKDTKAGLANLVAKILKQGINGEEVYEFADKLEQRAIDFNVSVGVETMSISISCLSEEFSFALLEIFKLLQNPKLNEATLQKVKKEQISQVLKNQSNFDIVANLQLKDMIFLDESLKNSPLGTKQSIESIGLEDIKEFLNYLDLSNLIIACSSDIKYEQIQKQIQNLKLNKGEKRSLKYYEITHECKEKIKLEKTQQAYIYFAAPYYYKKEAALEQVASFILGSGGFGSRLMEEIRVKKGLAYSIYSYNQISKCYSYFSGYMQTKNENKENAISSIKNVILNFVNNGVTQDELDKAKDFILGSEPLRNETIEQVLLREYNDFYFGFEKNYYKQKLKEIEKIKLIDLNSYIKSHDEITKLSFSSVCENT